MPDLITIIYKLTTNVYSYLLDKHTIHRVDTTYISGQLEFISKFKYPPINYLFMGFLRYVCEIVTGRMYTLIFVLSTDKLWWDVGGLNLIREKLHKLSHIYKMFHFLFEQESSTHLPIHFWSFVWMGVTSRTFKRRSKRTYRPYSSFALTFPPQMGLI